MRMPLLKNANSFSKICVEGNLTLTSTIRTDGFWILTIFALFVWRHTNLNQLAFRSSSASRLPSVALAAVRVLSV
jgi:hypothetical protein